MDALVKVIGIDVSKAKLDCWALPAQEAWGIDNDDGGIAALLTQLRTRAPELVVLEATGGYETQAATALAAAGWRVAVVNPRQVRRFAQALNRLAKTDRIDARCWPNSAAQSIRKCGRCLTRRRRNWRRWWRGAIN